MAKRVIKTPYVSIDASDRSSWFDGFTLTRAAGEVVVTTFGDSAVAREGGLIDNNCQLTGFQTDADEVNAELFAKVGTKLTIILQAGNGATGTPSTSDPTYTFSALLTSLDVMSGNVGEASRFTLNLPVDGEITRATS